MVTVCSLQFGRGDRCDAILEEEPRQGAAQLLGPLDVAGLVRLCREYLGGFEVHQTVQLVVVQRFVDLDELAVRQSDNAPGLAAMQRDLAVLALQRKADAARDDEAEDRAEEEQRTQPGVTSFSDTWKCVAIRSELEAAHITE